MMPDHLPLKKIIQILQTEEFITYARTALEQQDASFLSYMDSNGFIYHNPVVPTAPYKTAIPTSSEQDEDIGMLETIAAQKPDADCLMGALLETEHVEISPDEQDAEGTISILTHMNQDPPERNLELKLRQENIHLSLLGKTSAFDYLLLNDLCGATYGERHLLLRGVQKSEDSTVHLTILEQRIDFVRDNATLYTQIIGATMAQSIEYWRAVMADKPASNSLTGLEKKFVRTKATVDQMYNLSTGIFDLDTRQFTLDPDLGILL